MYSRKLRIVILKPWIVIDKARIMDDYPRFLVKLMIVVLKVGIVIDKIKSRDNYR